MSARRDTRLPPIRCHTEQLERWTRRAHLLGWTLSEFVRVALDYCETRPGSLRGFREFQQEIEKPGS